MTFCQTRSYDLLSLWTWTPPFFANILCYACDQETVKWQDGEAPITLRVGHAPMLKSTVNYRDENLKKHEWETSFRTATAQRPVSRGKRPSAPQENDEQALLKKSVHHLHDLSVPQAKINIELRGTREPTNWSTISPSFVLWRRGFPHINYFVHTQRNKKSVPRSIQKCDGAGQLWQLLQSAHVSEDSKAWHQRSLPHSEERDDRKIRLSLSSTLWDAWLSTLCSVIH